MTAVYGLLADLVLLLHLAFVGFVLFGALLIPRSRAWLLLHPPALIWAVVVEIRGMVCPLTPLENHFRRLAFQEGYAGGFVEQYLVPLLYPEALTRHAQVGLGLGVLVVNLAIYAWLFPRLLRRETRAALFTLPNLISLSRLVLAPGLLFVAAAGWRGGFLGLLAVVLATDAVDGWLARRLDLRSELGAKLDSWGDLLVFAVTPVAVWWLWPELMARERFWLLAASLALVLPLLVGLAKFRRITSYHTYGAKLSAVLLAVGILVLLLDLAAWPFRLAVGVWVLAEAEEIAISLALPRWRADVPSIVHALRLCR
ncbi:MAG: DUF2784 family protein [Thermodesulfobacteriota bacterium]